MRARRRWAWPDRRQGGFWALIELVVVAVIIVLAMMYYLDSTRSTVGVMGGGGAAGGQATSTPGVALQRAKGVECRNNLQQIRDAIATYQAQYGGFPPDVQSLQVGVPLKCPVGGEPYQYDPNTGQVHCTHPGHESY